MTDAAIARLWDAQRQYHGGEPCKMGHLEFARAVLNETAAAAYAELTAIEPWWKRIGCVRNPGCHTGEEAARDNEIADLRAALAALTLQGEPT